MTTYLFEKTYAVVDFYRVEAESEEEARRLIEGNRAAYLYDSSEPIALTQFHENGSDLIFAGVEE